MPNAIAKDELVRESAAKDRYGNSACRVRSVEIRYSPRDVDGRFESFVKAREEFVRQLLTEREAIGADYSGPDGEWLFQHLKGGLYHATRRGTHP